MQPYFFPYAGYFRLFAMTDIFLFLDDVQFPRTGWVHRNKFHTINSGIEWITLPLEKGDRNSTKITDLKYREPEEITFRNMLNKTKYLSKIPESLINFRNPVIEDLVNQIKFVCNELGYTPQYLRSSDFPEFSIKLGQEKIVDICKHFGAKKYLNLNGGKSYYSKEIFERNNIDLEILSPFVGESTSIVDLLIAKGSKFVTSEISKNLIIE
jgi:hypothetical protein